MFSLSRRKKKKQKEELTETSEGIYNPIRTFSSHQILQATNNFDRNHIVFIQRFTWYKGTIENKPVLIKKYSDEPFHLPDNIYREITVSSIMSSHKNVLKLLGCCLEFPHPVLVCEYPENGTLTIQEREGTGIKPLPWNVRSKIAKKIADAVTYLHTKFPRTIIHRELTLENIFLDESWTAKLTSFSLSIPIPEGDSGVTAVICGSTTYVEPCYLTTGFVTENVDVYSLGFIMLRLLTGKPEFPSDPVNGERIMLLNYIDKFLQWGRFTELIDPSMLNSPRSRRQMKAFLELALRCVRSTPGEDVLHMIDVAKELKQIENKFDRRVFK